MSAKQDFGFLPKGFDLEPELLDQISARSGIQRCLIGHDELLLIVHEVPQAGVPEREPLVFWRTPAGGWFGPDSRKGLGQLSALLERYHAVVDEYEAVIDESEGAAEVFKVLRHAGPLARSTRNMLVAIEQACTHDDDNRELMTLKDRGRELERAAELLYHDAKLVLDFQQAERAEEQQAATERLNTIAFRLNLMAGFFLPLVGIGGLMGMNVDLPEFVHSWFWGIFFGGLLLGVVVLFLVGWKTGGRE
ncbi:CorA family divalent cation transporter [Haloferula chungangensis]|uniref:CorA family divalent cation transporter n=1 Tax=Haloferula chungangensis TaxID=1048331 RepID=A0ABW2L0K7_9BACT